MSDEITRARAIRAGDNPLEDAQEFVAELLKRTGDSEPKAILIAYTTEDDIGWKGFGRFTKENSVFLAANLTAACVTTEEP